jgi:hypothetical protein
MPEKYYEAASIISHLQIVTSKEGLIISLRNRALGSNGEWSRIILNDKQAEGLIKFIRKLKKDVTD